MFREEKGVTLVGLVVFIAALLIISGVAISVFIQNSDIIVADDSSVLNDLNPNSTISSEEAMTKLKLIFELLESNYQTELAKGNLTQRSEKFTAANIASTLTEYNVKGNTESSLGEIDLSKGVTINYNNEYTFLVKVSDYGIVSVTTK